MASLTSLRIPGIRTLDINRAFRNHRAEENDGVMADIRIVVGALAWIRTRSQ